MGDGMRFGLRVEGDTPDETYENTRGEGFGAEVRRRVMEETGIRLEWEIRIIGIADDASLAEVQT